MANSGESQLAPYIERARKILQYEQRTNHQDRAVRPGGLEAFAVHWADEVSGVCRSAGLELRPVYRFTEYLAGYRQQDPMQRAASLRGALAVLNEISNGAPAGPAPSPSQAAASSGSNEKSVGKQEAHPSATPAQPAAGQPAHKTPQSSAPASANGSGGKTTTTNTVQKDGANRENRDSKEDGREAKEAKETKETKETKEPGKPAQNGNRIGLDAGMSVGHTALAVLNADITSVPGVGQSAAAKLHHLGVRSVRDLLLYFPREHRDYSKLEKIADLPFNEVVTTMGMIWEVETHRTSGGRTRTVATISDDTGRVRVSWFNQPYLQKQLKAAQGSYLVVTGMKQRFGNKVEFSVRSHELPEQGDLLNTGRLVPIYALTEGLHAKTLRRFTKWLTDRYSVLGKDPSTFTKLQCVLKS